MSRRPSFVFRLSLVSAFVATLAAARVSRAAGDSLVAISADMGVGAVGSAASSTAQVGIDLRSGNFALGLFGRVRLMFEGDRGSAIWRRDYDETSDFAHLLRYLHMRHHFGATQMRIAAGEVLGFTLGHGTLLRDYSNVADPDHPHAGMQFDLRGESYEIAVLVDNVLRPAVVASRLGVRPFSDARRLTLGVSFAADPRVPQGIRLDAEGNPAIDDRFQFETDDATLVLFGLDAQYIIGDPSQVQFTPYTDVNSSLHGIGLHSGALLRAPIGDSWLLSAQAEYRLSSSKYIPRHIGTFYDVERYQSRLASQRSDPPLPLYADMRNGSFGGHGVMGQIGLECDTVFAIKTGYRYQPGPERHRSWLRIVVNPLKDLRFGSMLLLRGLGESTNGDGVAALSEARYRINDYLYALAQYVRVWSVNTTALAYKPLQTFNIAIGGTLSR